MENNILHNVWPEWKVVRRINRGSFGVVYEAVRSDHGVESRAAIKVISIPQDESELDSLRTAGLTADASRTYFQEVVNDFVGEIQIMESFKGSQNIVSVEDYKVIEKTDKVGWDIYIRMELLTPLVTYLSDKVLTEAEVIGLGCDICAALERCAQRNVIHRDIKPDNIFVNEFGDFKLGDFGIARKLENVTGGLSQKGTYNYMAPEVVKGNHYDATVDIYSLGLVLYWLLNRKRLPFLPVGQQLLGPRDLEAANRRRLDGEPLPAPRDASPEMTEVILTACDPEPSKRFASATAMKNALMSVGTGGSHNGAYMDGSADQLDETIQMGHASQAAHGEQNTSGRAASDRSYSRSSRDPNETLYVNSAPNEHRSASNEIRTFGEEKESKKLPLIPVIAVLLILLGGSALIFSIGLGIGRGRNDSEKSEETTQTEAESLEEDSADEDADAEAQASKQSAGGELHQDSQAAEPSVPDEQGENSGVQEAGSDLQTAVTGHYVLPTAVPEEYYYYNGHTYAFYDASRYGFTSYDEVSAFCHEQGGHLAVINDRAENSYLYDLMEANYKITVFFGYTDKDQEGTWAWDGDNSDYENWTRTGDWYLPDNGESWGGGEWKNGGEDYAEFNYDRDTNWGAPNDTTWNDAAFMENTTIFFCEWDYDMREAEEAQK